MGKSRVNNDQEISGVASIVGGIAVGTSSSPDSKALLDLQSTTKGMLFPRMTQTERDNNISSPPTGLTVFNTTTNKLNVYNGAAWSEAGGSGQGGINYISENNGNSDFETDASGWNTYSDAAGTSPVDGTGGTATVTIARSTSSPLRGTASGLITKPASNVQGQGISRDITIARADRAKILAVQFKYEIASGTFVGGASSDIRVYIKALDGTDTNVYQVAPYTLEGSVSGISYDFKGIFQTSSDATQYRIIWHFATTSASAFTMKIDDVYVGPDTTRAILGAPITDWASYTPTFSAGFGTVTGIAMFYRRVGSSIEVQGSFTCGTTANSVARISLPAGLSVDTSKVATTQGGLVGQATHARSTTNNVNNTAALFVAPSQTTNISFTNFGDGTTANNLTEQNVTFFYGTGNFASVKFSVPIAGWSSTVQMSNDTDSRVVALIANNTSGSHGTSGSYLDVAWSTTVLDTHGAWNGTTYTFPSPGIYDVTGAVAVGSNTTGVRVVALNINGSVVNYSGPMGAVNGGLSSVPFAFTVNVSAGTTAKIQFFQNSGGSLNYGTSGENHLSISKRQGPSTVAATETVVASYRNTAGTAINTTPTAIAFATRLFDSHGAMSGSSFTCPVSGTYQVSAFLTLVSVTFTTTQGLVVDIYKNGSLYKNAMTLYGNGAANNYRAGGTLLVQASAGDTIAVYGSLLGTTSSLFTGAGYNYFDVLRVGN